MRILRGSTYANVVSTLALALVVGYGGAHAAGLITSADIKDGSIRPVDLAPSARTAAYSTPISHSITLNDGSWTKLDSLSVPAGTYLIVAEVNLVAGNGTTEWPRCRVSAGGTEMQSEAGVATGGGVTIPVSATARMSRGSISVSCFNFGDEVHSIGGRLTAVQVASAKLQ